MKRLRPAAFAFLCAAMSGGCRDQRAAPAAARPDTAVAPAPESGGSGGSGGMSVAPGVRAPGSAVGLAYETLPADVTLESGAVIPTAAGAARFDFALVQTPLGPRVWLESDGPRMPSGRSSHLVVAELAVPPLARDEHVVMASCDAAGRLDPQIVAVVIARRGDPAQVQVPVRQAWRADLASRQFTLMALTGITCDDPDAAP